MYCNYFYQTRTLIASLHSRNQSSWGRSLVYSTSKRNMFLRAYSVNSPRSSAQLPASFNQLLDNSGDLSRNWLQKLNHEGFSTNTINHLIDDLGKEGKIPEMIACIQAMSDANAKLDGVTFANVLKHLDASTSLDPVRARSYLNICFTAMKNLPLSAHDLVSFLRFPLFSDLLRDLSRASVPAIVEKDLP
eukprot:TRINITY_DN16488_c0_g1_i1.p1 TRINITY_DN16488_c0_g1~~TRINITY_DN16488_c0_g1_i1.p1  ORF type:complete len:190 (+),score=21.15 TRINITY_DN16488_c0_g1_i1:19-588(+)